MLQKRNALCFSTILFNRVAFRLWVCCLGAFSHSVLAHDWNNSRPDSHAPISVMGDHTHNAGEWMFAIRHMNMQMKGLQDGEKKLSNADFFSDTSYLMAPLKMDAKMNMFGLMYAPTNSLTLLLSLPYIEKEMLMEMRMPEMSPGAMQSSMNMENVSSMNSASAMTSAMRSKGFGDLKIGALKNLYKQGGTRLHANIVLSLPSGSIDEKNAAGVALPYGMQLGSGSYDVLPSLTFNHQREVFSWGAQVGAILRSGKNSRNYRLGDSVKAQGWIQKPVHQRLSFSYRIALEKTGRIQDSRTLQNPMMSPLLDPDNSGGQWLTHSLGANLTLPHGNRLAIEATHVNEQRLNGVQLARQDYLSFGWQMSFK